MSRIVVVVDGEASKRAAFSLTAHPGISHVSVLAPATSKHFPVVESVDGHDIVVGRSPVRHDLPTVIADEDLRSPGIFGGSVLGLVLALAVGVDEVDSMAAALPGDPAGDVTVVFPSPIDGRPSRTERLGGHPIQVGRGEGALAAAMVTSPSLHRVIVDDHTFMEGIALAAAAALLLDGIPNAPTPAWTLAASYLQTAVDMGLVIGERTPAR